MGFGSGLRRPNWPGLLTQPINRSTHTSTNTKQLILGFCMAVFVYPWWATFLNFAIAAYLTVYLVRTYHICIYSFIPIPNVLTNTTKTQQKRQQATHLRRVVLCHIGRFRMLLGIGSLYQFPLWFQAAKDLMAGYRAGHLGTSCVVYMSSIKGPRGTEIPSHARTHAPTHSIASQPTTTTTNTKRPPSGPAPLPRLRPGPDGLPRPGRGALLVSLPRAPRAWEVRRCTCGG